MYQSLSFRRIASAIFILSFVFTTSVSYACTGIIIKTADGQAIPARTMEFSFDIESNLLVIPSGITIKSLSSNPDKTGLVYTTKYGFTGMNGVDKPVVFDGVNEAGVYFGAFYFAGLAQFEELTEENRENAVSSEELGNFILGTCASVAEVKTKLKSINLVGTYIDVINGFAPFHYAVSDKYGNSIVIEYTAAGLTIYDNTINTICNNPGYDWHLTNLSNYVNLSPYNVSAKEVNGMQIKPFGEGSGLLGLPGDHSSPSRFIRAAVYANSVLTPANTEEGIFTAFHTLNVFDIPKGSIRTKHEGGEFTDYTIWTSAADTKNQVYYFKTHKNQVIKKIDLKSALASAKGMVKVIPSETPRTYEDVSKDFRG